MSCAATFDNVGISSVSQSGGWWNAGGDTDANVAKLSQFIHIGVDLPCAWPPRTENGFRAVKDKEYLFEDRNGRKEARFRGSRQAPAPIALES